MTGRELAIPVVSALDIAGDPHRFYTRYAAQPLIVRDCYPPGHRLRALDLESIETMLGDIRIHVYDGDAEDPRDVPASAIFAGVRGTGEPYNVVDFYLSGTPLGALFDVPPFLRHNWFPGAPANQDRYEKCLVLSPAGAFTALHQDAYAMQGWMFLIAGRKTWTCYPPDCVACAFHPGERRFYNSRRDSPADFPALAARDRFTGEIGPGDLLYFPAGWLHEVVTHEVSYGVGGSVLNDYQIEDHMRGWLWERDMNCEGALDLKGVIERMPADRFAGEFGQRRAAAALELCARWESRRHAASSAARISARK